MENTLFTFRQGQARLLAHPTAVNTTSQSLAVLIVEWRMLGTLFSKAEHMCWPTRQQWTRLPRAWLWRMWRRRQRCWRSWGPCALCLEGTARSSMPWCICRNTLLNEPGFRSVGSSVLFKSVKDGVCKHSCVRSFPSWCLSNRSSDCFVELNCLLALFSVYQFCCLKILKSQNRTKGKSESKKGKYVNESMRIILDANILWIFFPSDYI